MGQTNAFRVSISESAYTFGKHNLAELLKELDTRLNGAECYVTITRTANLISKIEYFSDTNRLTSDLMAERQITYTNGKITGVVDIFYQPDGVTEDSRVTATITRDSEDRIETCDSVFSTTENTKL